jgi:hypothetical protein
MATVRVRILTVRITLSVCPFNRMAHTANNVHLLPGQTKKIKCPTRITSPRHYQMAKEEFPRPQGEKCPYEKPIDARCLCNA